MKSISTKIKGKVFELFLQGYSYDEIAKQTGIGKGTVASIIDDFRNGVIPIPPGMGEYVDTLRKLAVDLKKQNTTVTQVLPYVKLHAKMQEMGVDEGQVDTWLDICQSIASQSASNNQFVQAAIELAEATVISGKTYGQVLLDYDKKSDLNKKMDSEIKKKKVEKTVLEQEYSDKVKQYTAELNTITNAIDTAQKTFDDQTKHLKLQLDDLMIQKNLYTEEINAVSAILTTESGKTGLSQEETKQIGKQITEAGSLFVHNKNLKAQKQQLETEVKELVEKKSTLEDIAEKLQMKIRSDEMVIIGQKMRRDELNAEIEVKGPELEKLKESIKEYEDTIYQANLVVGFLVSPKSLKEQLLDDLVRLLIALRQKTLGIELAKVKDKAGNLICECAVPTIDSVNTFNVDMDKIRGMLALHLAPLLKDKYITIIEHKIALAKLHAEMQGL